MLEAPRLALPGAGDDLPSRLLAAGILAPIDYHFARTLGAFAGASEEVILCAAFASRAVQLGHVCAEVSHIAELASQPLAEEATRGLTWPSLERLLGALRESPLCSDGSARSPLVLDAHGRLYLERYAAYERELAAALHARARRLEVDVALLARGIQRLFPDPAQQAAHRLAAVVASLHALAVICGGPGTGKTTTVVKILALLQEQALAQRGSALRMLLLAPTGKAARRLASSVAEGLAALDVPQSVRAAIPTEASTLHRALGFSRVAAQRFRHDAGNPLAADVVLIDEVSMVDLGLLYHVVRAIRPDARLILQGDKDQLASVEAGAILGDIYNPVAAARWSSSFAEQVSAITGGALSGTPGAPPLGDCLVHLSRSFRYDPESGIGRLARAINSGDVAAASSVLRAHRGPSGGDCQWFEPAAPGGPKSLVGEALAGDPLEALATAGYAAFIQSTDPTEKLARLGSYRILCAHRQGRSGVTHMNLAVESWLTRAGLIHREGAFYENRPLIITQNDYALGLFNGDVGVVVKDGAGRLRVCFESIEGTRFISVGRLPPHETVFATTIHKSQGSEFDEIVVVLPPAESRLATRELLYTAVTRARTFVRVVGSEAAVRAAVARPVSRASGLRHRLAR